MRLVYWNIRAGGGKRIQGIFDQLLAWQPDVIGLSEFRGTPASQQLAAWLTDAGWPHQLQTIDPKKRATNSLLLASKFPIEPIELTHAPDEPRRWLLVRVQAKPAFVMGLTHVLNYTTKRKYPMLNAILDVLDKWDLGPALFGGDTNCGRHDLDEENENGPVFRKEHDWMLAVDERDWADAWRHLHGDARAYTWYSHRNNGFRLDQAFVNPELLPALKTIQYRWGHDPNQPNRRDALSDHAAIVLELVTQ